MSQTLNAAIAVVGIDIGKNTFHIVGHDERGECIASKMVAWPGHGACPPSDDRARLDLRRLGQAHGERSCRRAGRHVHRRAELAYDVQDDERGDLFASRPLWTPGFIELTRVTTTPGGRR